MEIRSRRREVSKGKERRIRKKGREKEVLITRGHEHLHELAIYNNNSFQNYSLCFESLKLSNVIVEIPLCRSYFKLVYWLATYNLYKLRYSISSPLLFHPQEEEVFLSHRYFSHKENFNPLLHFLLLFPFSITFFSKAEKTGLCQNWNFNPLIIPFPKNILFHYNHFYKPSSLKKGRKEEISTRYSYQTFESNFFLHSRESAIRVEANSRGKAFAFLLCSTPFFSLS